MAPTPATDTTLTPVEDNSAASVKIATPIDPELERCAVATTVNGDALELFAVGDDAERQRRVAHVECERRVVRRGRRERHLGAHAVRRVARERRRVDRE